MDNLEKKILNIFLQMVDVLGIEGFTTLWSNLWGKLVSLVTPSLPCASWSLKTHWVVFDIFCGFTGVVVETGLLG